MSLATEVDKLSQAAQAELGKLSMDLGAALTRIDALPKTALQKVLGLRYWLVSAFALGLIVGGYAGWLV